MVHWSPFVMSFKKKYPWIQLAGHAGTEHGEGQSGGKTSLAQVNGLCWPELLLIVA